MSVSSAYNMCLIKWVSLADWTVSFRPFIYKFVIYRCSFATQYTAFHTVKIFHASSHPFESTYLFDYFPRFLLIHSSMIGMFLDITMLSHSKLTIVFQIAVFTSSNLNIISIATNDSSLPCLNHLLLI